MDISHLEQQLKSTQLLSEKEGVQIQSIVILSAGSNVTGLLVDVAQINTLIHSFNGIACWDFAAVSCHGKIDINPPQSVHASTDVAFFSPHKLLGGPGASGRLLVYNAVSVLHCKSVLLFLKGFWLLKRGYFRMLCRLFLEAAWFFMFLKNPTLIFM